LLSISVNDMVANVRPSCRRSQVMWDGATQATDFFFQSETNQHPSCVEAELNSGVHLAETSRTFDRAHLEISLFQRDRRGQSTDSRPYDDDPRHGGPLDLSSIF
jgi:hypothetical protein